MGWQRFWQPLRIKEFLFDWNHKEKEPERKKQQAREALRHKMAQEKDEREERDINKAEPQAARKPPVKPPQGQTQTEAGTAENPPANRRGNESIQGYSRLFRPIGP